MKWIKASERLPEKHGNYFIKCWNIGDEDGQPFYAVGAFHYDSKGQPLYIYFNASTGTAYPFIQKIEWLDESIEPCATSSRIEELEKGLEEIAAVCSDNETSMELVKQIEQITKRLLCQTKP